MITSKTDEAKVPRIRLAKDIDFGKADPDCKLCGGSGISGYQRLDSTAGAKKKGLKPALGFRSKRFHRIPIVCQCVMDGGGCGKDALDEAMDASDRLKDKTTVFEKDGKLYQPDGPAGYVTSRDAFVCHGCRVTVPSGGVVEGKPVLPDGWRYVKITKPGGVQSMVPWCTECRRAFEG